MILPFFFSLIPLVVFSYTSGYITCNNSFPQVLSSKDEKYYLECMKNGDQEARNVLIERNLRLVAHVVKKYSTNNKDMDDLISIGTIGLIKAINTYDDTKGTRLATYAARCIDNEILMSIRSNKKKRNEVYLQDSIGIDKEGNEISLIDVLGSDADEISDKVEKKMQIRKLYEKLNGCLKDREKKIIEMRYGLNNDASKTQIEIAKLLGISRSYVSRIEKKALIKLSKELSN